MKKFALLLALATSLAQAQTSSPCVTGYEVEQATSPDAVSWDLVGTLPSNAGTMTITPPATHGTYWYRVTMTLNDGSSVKSTAIPILVTTSPKPMTINIAKLFEMKLGKIYI